MAFDLRITAAQIPNQELLTQQLNTALPGRCFGISTYPASSTISVWMSDDHTPAEDATATATVSAHDPSIKTAQQVQDAVADTAATALHAQAISEAQFWEGLTAASITTVPQAVALIVRLGKVCAAILRVLLRRGLV